MKTYFIDNKSDELILFFLGWGMDERPMLPLNSTKDILYFYDYQDLNFNFDFSKYSKFYSIGYSAGVSVLAYLNSKLPKVEYSIAYNGSINLIDENFGLSSNIIKVFKNINLENYMDFRKNYLTNSNEELKKFNVQEPYRTVESSMAELDALEKYPFKNVKYKYDKVYISKDDKIFPIEKQEKYWEKENIKVISGGHFSFYNFQSIDELFN